MTQQIYNIYIYIINHIKLGVIYLFFILTNFD